MMNEVQARLDLACNGLLPLANKRALEEFPISAKIRALECCSGAATHPCGLAPSTCANDVLEAEVLKAAAAIQDPSAQEAVVVLLALVKGALKAPPAPWGATERVKPASPRAPAAAVLASTNLGVPGPLPAPGSNQQSSPEGASSPQHTRAPTPRGLCPAGQLQPKAPRGLQRAPTPHSRAEAPLDQQPTPQSQAEAHRGQQPMPQSRAEAPIDKQPTPQSQAEAHRGQQPTSQCQAGTTRCQQPTTPQSQAEAPGSRQLSPQRHPESLCGEQPTPQCQAGRTRCQQQTTPQSQAEAPCSRQLAPQRHPEALRGLQPAPHGEPEAVAKSQRRTPSPQRGSIQVDLPLWLRISNGKQNTARSTRSEGSQLAPSGGSVPALHSAIRCHPASAATAPALPEIGLRLHAAPGALRRRPDSANASTFGRHSPRQLWHELGSSANQARLGSVGHGMTMSSIDSLPDSDLSDSEEGPYMPAG